MASYNNDRGHQKPPPLADLLAQVPLTVSPFVTLPTAATLPYTYKSMPSSLPPSATGTGEEKPKFIVSPSGHAAHPDDIIASCRALREHIDKVAREMDQVIREMDERARERELAEKRRLAPGWLDSDARLLEPQRKTGDSNNSQQQQLEGQLAEMSIQDRDGGLVSEMAVDQGEELDRAFGRFN
ncbi:hypothetical protein F5Y17DRAFT_351506 [Xylariaceae sp. FL0594]|nr:hypothetical protein F5Y17DRAFT_351506 [Xylariaceae sp. FL0594]